MNHLIIWLFGIWIAAFTGAALVIVGFDIWISVRREALRTKGEAK